MKKEIKQITRDITVYVCDKCNRSSEHEGVMKEHYAKNHTFTHQLKNEKVIGYYFLTEKDARDFLCAYEIYHIDWDGAGWYIFSDFSPELELINFASWEEEQKQKAQSILDLIENIRAEITETKNI